MSNSFGHYYLYADTTDEIICTTLTSFLDICCRRYAETMTESSTQRTHILILFGGQSTEHDVSMASAKNVLASLANRYEPLLVYIDHAGVWWHASEIAKPSGKAAHVVPLPGTSSVMIGKKRVQIDVLFPALHGTYGEDGAVQGLARMLNAPIVGCGITGSTLCFNKVLAKQLLEVHGISTVPYRVYESGQEYPLYEDLAASLGKTLFVKPARQGSSIGVSCAGNEAELRAAIREATRFDTTVLIEQALSGARELEVAILQTADRVEASVVGEVIPDREFYSYESKYDAGSTSQLVIPTSLDVKTSQFVQATAAQAFRALRCRGLARVDFLMDKAGKVYLNEINTMPGFTDVSMYPKLWEATGMSQTKLVSALISQAIC